MRGGRVEYRVGGASPGTRREQAMTPQRPTWSNAVSGEFPGVERLKTSLEQLRFRPPEPLPRRILGSVLRAHGFILPEGGGDLDWYEIVPDVKGKR